MFMFYSCSIFVEKSVTAYMKKECKYIEGNDVLTNEGQIPEQSSQEVHDVHDSNGDVGDVLHLCLCRAEIREYKHETRNSDRQAHNQIKKSLYSLYSQNTVWFSFLIQSDLVIR